MPDRPQDRPGSGGPRPWPLLVMGAGLGGFVDGIALHQVLQ